jgi:PhnB protein
MLIPIIHFNGECAEAIPVYEKAFNTKARYIDYRPDGKIAHSQMRIHGSTVYLNDRFGNKDKGLDCAVHLALTFKTVEAFDACYEALKEGGSIIDPFKETPYSPKVGNFMDRFGVLWGFMVR